MTSSDDTLQGVTLNQAALKRLLPGIIEFYMDQDHWSPEIGLKVMDLVYAAQPERVEDTWDQWFAFCRDLLTGAEVRSFRDLLEDAERF